MGLQQSTFKKAEEVSMSSGTHIIEIHAPSLGGGIMIVLIILAIIFTTYKCFRRIFHNTNRRSPRPPNVLPLQIYRSTPQQEVQEGRHQPFWKPIEDDTK